MTAALELKDLTAKNLNLLSHSCSPSRKPLTSVRIPSFPSKDTRFSSRGRIKCSFEYNGSNGHDQFLGPQYPRPQEIQWKKELCNSVQLIGIVATPVQFKQLNSGKVVAWSRLAVKKSQTETAWINLTLWNELAHVAIQHVEKGQQIYVSGRLVSDTVESEDGKQQTYYKVVVQQLNFVERSASPMASYDEDSGNLASGKKRGYQAANSTGSIEELWQAFFANPMEWWDNRRKKKNPNYPDFKHKDTGEALWVEGRYNPPWVKSQLAILDERMESFHDQTASMHLSDNFPF